MAKQMFSQLLNVVSACFNALFGKISWNSPGWIKYLRQQSTDRPKAFFGVMFGLLFLTIVGFYGYFWYQSRPRPVQIIAQVKPPKLSSVENDIIPEPLNINFGVISGGELIAKPVAPIKLIGKEITDGISISPEIEGTWTWENDSHLVFTPATDWPAGQSYTIYFGKNFFAKGSKMASFTSTFQTLPFEAIITEFKFYQDPTNPQLRQAIAKVNFSFPVDENSLTKHVNLLFQALKNGKQDFDAQHFKYTINYDKYKRTAFIQSEPLALPEVPRYLELLLEKGIKPVAGPSVTTEDIKATVLIPDASSYFKVLNAAATIVRTPENRPEQVLTLETTLGVTQAELNKSLHVYLLPRDYPADAEGNAKQNYQWQSPGEVTSNILALSKPLPVTAVPTDRDYATLHSYRFNVATPAYLFLKLDKGSKAFGNFTLANDYVAVIKVPEYPQEISFLHKGSLLALGTEEKLSVLVRGLSAVKFNFARVLPDDVNHLVTQTSGDFSNPFFIDPNFNQNNISEIFSEIRQFNISDPGKEQYTALDLGKYLAKNSAGNHPLGLFLLQARGWDSVRQIPLDVQTNRLVLITDLGLIVKDNNNGTHDVFVQSITKGTPVKNAKVSILGKNGLPIFTYVSDGEGHVSFPILSDFTNEREPVVYIVQNGSDVSFIPYNRADRQLNYTRFDVGGVTSDEQNQSALTAYLFSDRGIYRPGDIAHIGMIVKQHYALPQPAGLPLEATVVDPRGTTIKDEKLTLNDTGYLTLDFQTTPTSPTGQYYINLYIVKDNHLSNLIGSMSVNVAEFLPDRLRISSQFSQQQPGWVSPVDLTAKVGLWNLYGAPAADHRVGGSITLTPHAVTFKEFPDYTFIDPLLDPKKPPKVFTDSLSDTRTNEHGQAQFDLNLGRFEKATYQLTFFAEGFEAEGGRSVTTESTALVSPLAYFVGYKPDGNLTFLKQNSVRNVNLIAVNPQLKQQSLAGLTIQLYEQHPVTTLVKKEDGTYQYQSIVQTTQISSNSFSISEEGTNYALPTQKIGDFLIIIADKNNMELSRFKYSVVGTIQQALPKNAELNVKLNKEEFSPGEEIEIQLTAPYTGAGLITLERDKIYAFQWFKTSTTASVQKIRIPADFQGNGYVNIAFVRDINSPEIFTSPLSFSVMPFSVTHKNRELQVDLSIPDLARPGEALPITYKTEKPGKIIVFAVDEGILQVSKYSPPDPLAFFFQKYALQVNTSQIVDQILPKFIAERELSAVGGDGGEAAMMKNLNPFKRKTEAPVVYWSGIMDTDATPHQITYEVPGYFNGTLRVMAVAVNADSVGSANKTTEVRGHFVINPNVPTFVAPGDEFEVTASIANNVEGSQNTSAISIELETSPALEILDNAKQTIVIPEGQERSVRYKIRAKAILGSADLKWNASLGDKSTIMTATLSVRPATVYSTSITSGYSTNATQTLSVNRILYPEYRTVEGIASTHPLILVEGLQRYLNEYPYGCTEQLVSKAFPLLAMANETKFAADSKEVKEKIQQLMQILSQRQLSNGGFNYWPDLGTQSNDFASIYAMHFLTEAKAQGFNVPNEIFSAGIGFLKDYASQTTPDLEKTRLRAYAIYLLTRNEIVTTNYLTNLQLTLDQHKEIDWRNDITSAYIAASYQMLKNSAEAEQIIGYFHPSENKIVSSDFYNQTIADSQYLYLLARHFPDRLSKSGDSLVMTIVDALNNDTISTVLSSYSSLALAAYGQFYPTTSDVKLSATELLNNGKKNIFESNNDGYLKFDINNDAKQITFNNPAKGGYFYQLIQAGFDKKLGNSAINQGIEAYREYRDTDNKVINNVGLGDDVTVVIRLRATDNQYHYNIALVDLLPGGFEVVRDSLTLTNIDYIDAREDRVIFFVSVGPESKEIIYHIKATNIGQYTVPPIYATAMYQPLIKSLGVSSTINVNN